MAVVNIAAASHVLLALDPFASTHTLDVAFARLLPIAPNHMTPDPSPPPSDGLHQWDLATLCDPPTPRANQSAEVPMVSIRSHRWSPTPTATAIMSHVAGTLPPPLPSLRERSPRAALGAGVEPPMPNTCRWSGAANGDDDVVVFDWDMNWTSGAVHCSYAGLTAVPPLPTGVLYMYSPKSIVC